ncbi:MAG: hypothetical protein Q7S52_01225 [bacterium]|nr:hypothetical protein [bacterium]
MSKAKFVYIVSGLAIVLIGWFIIGKNQEWSLVPGQNEESFNYDQNLDKLPLGEVDIKLHRISERHGGRPDLGLNEERDVDFFIERTDTGQKQEGFWVTEGNPNGEVYTSDLPLAIRTEMLYTSDPSDQARDGFGSSCHFGGFPHTCTLNLYNDEAGKPKTILIKMVFADNTYAQKEVTIPYGGMLDEPKLVEPKTAPKNGERFSAKFLDIGADRYRIAVSICHPYANNGINPCLNEHNFDYNVKRDGGKIVLGENISVGGFVPAITSANNIIEIRSDMPIEFSGSDSEIRYGIFAEKFGVIADDIATHLESRSETTFTLHE